MDEPTAAPMDELIARLEQLSGPDREVDAEIWLSVTPGATRCATTVNHHTGPYVIDETRNASGRLITVPAFTKSLDAAITLTGNESAKVERWYGAGDGALHAFACVETWNGVAESLALGKADGDGAEARALCIAALKARASQPKTLNHIKRSS